MTTENITKYLVGHVQLAVGHGHRKFSVFASVSAVSLFGASDGLKMTSAVTQVGAHSSESLPNGSEVLYSLTNPDVRTFPLLVLEFQSCSCLRLL